MIKVCGDRVYINNALCLIHPPTTTLVKALKFDTWKELDIELNKRVLNNEAIEPNWVAVKLVTVQIIKESLHGIQLLAFYECFFVGSE